MDRGIIRLGAEHREAAVRTLGAAFHDDSAIRWVMPAEKDRARRLQALMGWLFELHLRQGFILGTPGAEVVTFWRPPGTIHARTPPTPGNLFRLLPILRGGMARARQLDSAVHLHLPKGEGWLHLRLAGVRPDLHGNGLCSAAIRAGTAEMGPARHSVVLETSSASNVALFRSLGFEVVIEWDVIRGGPHFWTMTRG